MEIINIKEETKLVKIMDTKMLDKNNLKKQKQNYKKVKPIIFKKGFGMKLMSKKNWKDKR